jgi:8-oxo-dGTP diphosphatase
LERQILSATDIQAARQDFQGAKLVLFLGTRIVVIRRDDIPGLPFPGCLDLPGGMREPGETPEETVLRETREELGLSLAPDDLVAPVFYAEPKRAWFFEAHLPAMLEREIVFGNEGQGWWMMDPHDFAVAQDAVPHFRDRVRACHGPAPGGASG